MTSRCQNNSHDSVAELLVGDVLDRLSIVVDGFAQPVDKWILEIKAWASIGQAAANLIFKMELET